MRNLDCVLRHELNLKMVECNEGKSMINNQQGGILSKIFIIPVGVALNKTVSDRSQGSDQRKRQEKTSEIRTERTKRVEIKVEREALSPVKPKQASSNQSQTSTKKEPAKSSAGVKLRYTVQTASYQEKKWPRMRWKRLKQRGYAAFIYSSQLPGKGIWYRVRLGSFSNKAAAEKLQKTIHAKEGISPIILLE